MIYRLIHNTDRQYFNLFKWLIDIGIETNSYINIYIDPKDVVQKMSFQEMLAYINERRDDIWVAKYEEILEVL